MARNWRLVIPGYEDNEEVQKWLEAVADAIAPEVEKQMADYIAFGSTFIRTGENDG